MRSVSAVSSLPPPLPEPPSEARTLGFLMREVYAQLQQRVYEAVAAAGHPGLRATHSSVLRHLPPDGGRVAGLARASGLAKQSMAYVVEDLIALGYLRAEVDPADARARRIAYTARGTELLAALVKASADAEASLAAALGEARVQALKQTLEAALAVPVEPPATSRHGSARHPRA